MRSTRLEAIDAARGLAALSVALYHQGFGPALTHLTGIDRLKWVGWPGSVLAVPLFFVISGFCIHLGWLARPQSEGFTRRFFLQRFFRIYPPWVFAVALSAIAFSMDGRSVELPLLIDHLTLANGFIDDYRLNAALWSVSVEACLYLLYPFWLWVRIKQGLVSAVALAAMVSAVSCYLTSRFFSGPTGPSLWFFLNVWIGWVAGAVLAESWHSDQGALFFRPIWWFAGSGAFGLFLLLGRLEAFTGAGQFLRLPLIICLCLWPLTLVMVIGDLCQRHTRIRPVRWLWSAMVAAGAFSYSLYLLHIPLQSLRFPIHNALAGHPSLQNLLFVGWFFIVLAAAWLAHRWIETPSIEFGRSQIRKFCPAPRAGA